MADFFSPILYEAVYKRNPIGYILSYALLRQIDGLMKRDKPKGTSFEPQDEFIPSLNFQRFAKFCRYD
jgi:hypothetical protein